MNYLSLGNKQGLTYSITSALSIVRAMLAVMAAGLVITLIPATAHADEIKSGEKVAWSTVKQEKPAAPKPKAKTVSKPKIKAADLPAPSGNPILVLEGEASYYSRAGCLGCNPLRIMANGQPLNDNALTMAIGADKVHLVGRMARVTSLATGKSAVVRITDTGGFYKAKYGNRVADLTIGTKTAIGMKGGVGQVRVEVL